MNRLNLAAAVLMALTFGVHVFAGGPEVHVAIQASELSEYLRAISAVLWHAVSVILAVFALAYLWLARNDNKALSIVLGATQLGFATLFLWYGTTLLGTIWPMPQWIVFLLIPAISAAGTLRQKALPA
ncbi:MAG: hypothetical protein JXQ85_00195 [Cognatishimia sp.]|uniref:hypothetical protein n=1 Tax=Cognatishimia sp. TaxID=2211648 RepID=UPI003B8E7D5C